MKESWNNLVAWIKHLPSPFDIRIFKVVSDCPCWMAWFVVGCCHTMFFVDSVYFEQEDHDEDTWNIYVQCPRWYIPLLRRRILSRSHELYEVAEDSNIDEPMPRETNMDDSEKSEQRKESLWTC